MVKKIIDYFKKIFDIQSNEKPKVIRPQHPTQDDFIKRNNVLKELEKQNKNTALKTCIVCGSKVSEDTIHLCAECNYPGCENCMTYDPSTKKYYCESCW